MGTGEKWRRQVGFWWRFLISGFANGAWVGEMLMGSSKGRGQTRVVVEAVGSFDIVASV